jgi:hypothetical protein
MIRHRYHQTVTLGRFNDALSWARELDQAVAQAGLPQARLLMPGVGPINQLILETEYASLADWEKAAETFFGTAEVMSVYRRGIELVCPGTHPWDEFEQEAPSALA